MRPPSLGKARLQSLKIKKTRCVSEKITTLHISVIPGTIGTLTRVLHFGAKKIAICNFCAIWFAIRRHSDPGAHAICICSVIPRREKSQYEEDAHDDFHG